MVNATKDFHFIVKNKEDLKGVPEIFYEITANSYNHIVKDSAEVATAEKGPWLINLDPTIYVPFMENCENRNLREMLYKRFITRASEGKFDNSSKIKRILEIRKEKASLLGYSDFAQLSLTKKI